MTLCEVFMELQRLEAAAAKQEIFLAETKESYDYARGYSEAIGKALDLLYEHIWEQERENHFRGPAKMVGEGE